MSTWTPELKEQAIEAYKALNPTPATTSECVKAVAEQLGQSPNGVRMILVKAEAYVKAIAVPTKGTTEKATTTTRVSKADSIADLVSAINDLGQEPDMDVIDKLTGKQAIYFTTILRSVEQQGE